MSRILALLLLALPFAAMADDASSTAPKSPKAERADEAGMGESDSSDLYGQKNDPAAIPIPLGKPAGTSRLKPLAIINSAPDFTAGVEWIMPHGTKTYTYYPDTDTYYSGATKTYYYQDKNGRWTSGTKAPKTSRDFGRTTRKTGLAKR